MKNIVILKLLGINIYFEELLGTLGTTKIDRSLLGQKYSLLANEKNSVRKFQNEFILSHYV